MYGLPTPMQVEVEEKDCDIYLFLLRGGLDY